MATIDQVLVFPPMGLSLFVYSIKRESLEGLTMHHQPDLECSYAYV